MKDCRIRILTGTLVAVLIAVEILLSFLLPIRFANAERLAIPTRTVPYFQSINQYDEEGEITDTVTAEGEMTGLELSHINEKTSILYAHHTPNAFVRLCDAYSEVWEAGKVERLDTLTEAGFGTLQFVFFNLDPSGEDFENDRSRVISRFAHNDSSALLDLYLPAGFDAAAVYLGNRYLYTAGDMGDYDPTEFIDPYSVSSFIPNPIDCIPQHIDLSFPISPNTISPDRLEAAMIVTVHYKARHGVDFSSSLPLIGKQESIKGTVSSALSVHIALLTAASAVLVAFFALAILKKSDRMFAPGVALLGNVLLIAGELIPFMGKVSHGAVLSFSAIPLLLGAAVCFQLSPNKKVSRLWLAILNVSLVNGAACLVLSLSASVDALRIYARISVVLMSAIAAAAAIIHPLITGDKPRAEAMILAVTCCTAAGSKAWLSVFPLAVSPAVCILFLTVALALWMIGYDIFRIEKRDILLQSNLQKEVNIQTAALRQSVADREKILSFVSHDMRKSALGIQSLAVELKNTSPNDAITNIANKIEGKNTAILNAMSEILSFSKRNFADEPFEAVSIPTLFDELIAQVEEDCRANGILLVTSSKNIACRAQKNTLLSILFNLVFNAIEHAECTEIHVSALKHDRYVQIRIADNGIGIESKKDIFSPFVTGEEEDNPNNSGLGLFLVKTQTENMGGKITYSAGPTGTEFTLSLLREIDVPTPPDT